MDGRVNDFEAFVLREARLLDEQRYAEWLELFADDGIYWIPTGPNQASPQIEHQLRFPHAFLGPGGCLVRQVLRSLEQIH